MTATQSECDELVAAWLAWDGACARLSKLADVAIAKDRRPPIPTVNTLAAEEARLVDAGRAVGVPLDFGRQVAARRRDGMSVTDAVQSAVNDHTAVG